MFKVLVLAYYFPPMGLSGVQRTLKFTKYMSEFGWKPTVITSGKTGYYAHDISMLNEANEADIEIIRTEAFDPNSMLSKLGTVKMPKEIIRKSLSRISKTLFIPDNKKSWSKKAYNVSKKALSESKFDMIFVSMPPFSIFKYAVKLKEEFDLPLIVDYRDLWFGNQFSFNPTPYHKYKCKSLEDDSLRKVDKVIVTNRKIKEFLLQTYPFLKFDDISIIRHGYDKKDIEQYTGDEEPSKKLVITYSGIFYEKITPKYFLKAFKKLSIEYPEIAANFKLNFVGHFRKENINLVEKLSLKEFVTDFGYLEHNEAVKKIMNSDVLWFMLNNDKGMETVTPGKLLEYIGTNKPILGCVPEGASKIVLEEYEASFITSPDDIDEIKNSLLKIHELYRENKLPVGNDFIVKSLDRKSLTEQLIKEFQFHLKGE